MADELPVVSPLEGRRAEVAQYQANIALYQTISASLPSEYPAHLEQYRVVEDRHATIGEITDLDDVSLLSDLWYHDDCERAIRTETVEMRKAMAILAIMEAQA
jgi:hypothetical protein